MALISAADYLQMTELKEMCLDEVPGILDHSNVISWWKEANKMNFDDIRDRCEKIMADDFYQVSQETDFLKLDLGEVQEYLINICSEIVDSDLILDALMRWVDHNEDRVPLLEDLLHKINLDKCSAEGIKAVMLSHETLLDKAWKVYKLLLQRTLRDTSIDKSKEVSQGLVVLGGRDKAIKPNHQCWKVGESGIQDLFEVPSDKYIVDASVCQMAQGFALTGGRNSGACFVFIASTRSWLRLCSLLEKRCGHGSVCVKDILYVLGGCVRPNKVEHSDSVHFMVMEGGHWEEGPSMPLSVRFPKVSSLNDKIYLLDEESLHLLCLDNGEVWNELAPLPGGSPCYGISLTSACGLLFAAGGYQRLCAWYNPTTDTWCTVQQPVQIHRYGSLAYHNDKLLLLGGSFTDGTDEVEEYDIDEDKWSMCSYKMPKKIYNHQAFLLDMQPRD